VSRLSFALALMLATVACNPKSLKRGYCNTATDCKTGEKCNPATRMCDPMTTDGSVERAEAGVDGLDGIDGRDASDVGEAPPATCRTRSMLCADGGYDGSPGVCEVEAGICVQCLTDDDCSQDSTKPVCEEHVCRPCKADAECKGGPGVCMFHQDGHCATDYETIYVKNAAGCTAGGGGTVATPYCLSQDGINAVGLGRALVVMRGPDALTEWAVATAPTAAITVVGQSSATVNPGARVGVRVSAGQVYVRDLKISSGSNVGVIAEAGAELVLNHCTVTANKGGILIDGAAFDIENTTITNNGPSADLSWGGIRLQSVLATGSARLNLLTITGNNPSGVSCSMSLSAVPSATGVLATANTSGDVSPTCGFMSCGTTVTATCGAQP
jgi:hypothetical protein